MDTVILLALSLVGLAAGLWARPIILDDAMITFRVAENLAYGRGFVYNVGERVQVTTTPLYAMLLAGGTWLFGSAVQAALMLNLSLATLIPPLTYSLGSRLYGRLTGLGGGLLVSLMPLLLIAFSMESYLYVTLILASLLAYSRQQYRLTGLLVGLTALVRGDGALLGAVLLTYDVLKTTYDLRSRAADFRFSIENLKQIFKLWLIIPAIGLPGMWYLFALAYYGSPWPATLGAKTAQGAFNWLGVRFLDGLLSYWQEWTVKQGRWELYLWLPLWVIGLGVTWQHHHHWLILIGRDLLYVMTFVALGVPAAEWYYAPLMPGLALLTAGGVDWLTGRLTGWLTTNRSSWQPYLHSLFCLTIILSLLMTIFPISQAIITARPDWKAHVYPEMGRWIADNTNASADLATIDIGHLGYWSGRPIIDIVGLAQPDVAAHIAEGDFGYAIRHYQPAMVVIGYSWLPEIQSRPWFQTNYVPREYFQFEALAEPLVLFSRPEGVKVQPPGPFINIHPLAVNFNQQIYLTGYQLLTPLAAGSQLDLTLFWQAEQSVEIDFTVFAQLVDADNQIIAQGDSQPQAGFYRTRDWQPGEQIIDRRLFLIPPSTPPGEYDLLLGLYNPADGQRLQILDEAGTFLNDHVRLSGLSVKQAR